MATKFDLAVFIGRFSPAHNGHLAVIHEGLKQANHMLILIGSSNAPRSHRTPFTFAERKEMLYHSIPDTLRDRVLIYPLEDAAYNDAKWVNSVQLQVTVAGVEAGYNTQPKVALIGHSKDSSSYYLKMFPQWGDHIEVPNYRNLNSTQIRNTYFSNIVDMWLTDCDGHKIGDLPQDQIVPTAVKDFLSEFAKTTDYKAIVDEYEFVSKYKASWATAPYAPIFVTTDAIIVQSGHVLLVRRRAVPGKGLWAMPGGFLNQNERIEDAVFRELVEETGIKVPEKVLRGNIRAKDVFDDPNRSSRGRTITHAFLVVLPNGPLPRVKGQDDADKAKWVPISELSRESFFEDHYDILINLLSRI